MHISEEISNLVISLYSHILLFLVIIIIIIILFIKMYFLSKVYISFFIICSIIYAILMLFPLYPIILIHKKKLYSRIVNLYKKLSLIVIFVLLGISILINIIIFLNIYGLFIFCKECPFNFSYNDIAKEFNINYNKNDIKSNINSKKCSNKRCLLIKENFDSTKTNISYICNFDSFKDFQSLEDKIYKIFFPKINQVNNEINCELFNENELLNENILIPKSEENFFIIKSFFKICSTEQIFYKCYRYEKPKEYDIDYDFLCPNLNDNIVILIISSFSIIFNFVLPLILCIYEHFKYKKILKLIKSNVIESVSTNKTSKNSINNNINNNINNENNNTNQIAKDDARAASIIVIGHITKEKVEEQYEDKKNNKENIENKNDQEDIDNNDDIVFNKDNLFNLRTIDSNNNIFDKNSQNSDRINLYENKNVKTIGVKNETIDNNSMNTVQL